MTAATYLVVLLAALTGSPGWALVTGLSFGLVRGSAVLLSSRCRSPESLRALHLKLARLEPASRRAVMAVEVVAAGILAAAGDSTGSALAGFVALALAGVLVVLSARQSASRPRPIRLGTVRPRTVGPRSGGRRIGGQRTAR